MRKKSPGPFWDCPCGAMNSDKARKCEACEAPREPESRQQTADRWCQWRTNGHSCLLPAVTAGGRSGYCEWHAQVLSHPQDATYEKFERFQEWLWTNQYCCIETHYPTVEVWGLLMGRNNVGPPSPCAQGEACKHFEFGAVSPEQVKTLKREFQARLVEILAKAEEVGGLNLPQAADLTRKEARDGK